MAKGSFNIEEAPPLIVQPRNASGRRKPIRWTVALKTAFLDHLAILCNVAASSRAIDVPTLSPYQLRRRDPAFAAAWEEALTLGYQAVETQLISAALNGPADDPDGVFDTELAKWLLRERRERGEARTRRSYGPMPKRATAEETDRAILAKLEKIEARKARA